ncbi:general odorant-binding protein 69-like [Armigeres subalbatus]|uniref:general odorant-binding protein 69-like n=1 Tax=Armigeres subalbatus TaxID=124917 RepID=UPI002ED3788C
MLSKLSANIQPGYNLQTTMRRLVSPILISLFVVLTVGLPHKETRKSFDTGLRECAQYFLISDKTISRYYKHGFPCKQEVKLLIRCTMLNLNAYNDDSGPVERVLGKFFRPCPTDTTYVERTDRCVEKALSRNPSDIYSRAYDSFMCYFHERGNLVAADQFIPKTALEITNLLEFDVSALGLSDEILHQYCQGNLLKEPNYPNGLFVWAVGGGYYSVVDGIQLDKIYAQYGVPAIICPETRQCAAEVAKTYCSSGHVTIMFNTFMNCIQSFLPLEDVGQVFASQQLRCKQFIADSS